MKPLLQPAAGHAADVTLRVRVWVETPNTNCRALRSTCHPRVEVCIDLKQQGVAGYDSWGDRPLPEHSLPANRDYQWGFTLIPVNHANGVESKLGYSYK